MMLFFQYFFISVVLQLFFSELFTVNGFQPNIILLFIILSQMPESNTSKAVLVGFVTGLFCDLVLFTGSYIGLSSLVFSICAFMSSRIRYNFVFRNFDSYWILTLLVGIAIYCLFRYDFLFFSNFFLFLRSFLLISLYSVLVSYILVKILSLRKVVLNA